MIVLLLFSFLAGIVTVLSPCILPILPIVLSGSIGERLRPFGIVVGFVASFTFFTLFLASIVRVLGIPADILRVVSIFVIGGFGIALVLPEFAKLTERLFSNLSRFFPSTKGKEGFGGGVILGLSIGLLWTPCVGPILASVISLALTGQVNSDTFFLTLAYSLGTAIPMFLIILGGQKVVRKVPLLTKNSQSIQRFFGSVMILTAVGIYFNFDRSFQSYILTKFPGYGSGLTKVEDNSLVTDNLDLLGRGNTGFGEKQQGEPMNNLLNDRLITAPEIIPGGEWFGLPAGRQVLTLSELRGRVVLVDFWTYTCINCIRTLPYLRDWHEKYESLGLTIIGVHTPEFEFEKSSENVKKAIADFDLRYPIVQDNEYKTWRAYSNRYWPAKYLIDKDGKIRYTHFGEGEYDETEKAIQELLEEDGEKLNIKIDNPNYRISARTPELYLGYARMGYLANSEQVENDKKVGYQMPEEIALNHFTFGGDWNVGSESSEAFSGSNLVLAFEAKQVFLVMKPKTGSGPVEVTDFSGRDVKNSVVDVVQNRLYELINLDKPGQHLLKIQFEEGNVEVFAFTFG